MRYPIDSDTLCSLAFGAIRWGHLQGIEILPSVFICIIFAFLLFVTKQGTKFLERNQPPLKI